MKKWFLVSNIIVALASAMIVYTKLTNLYTLDIGAILLVVIGIINTVLSTKLK